MPRLELFNFAHFQLPGVSDVARNSLIVLFFFIFYYFFLFFFLYMPYSLRRESRGFHRIFLTLDDDERDMICR